MTILGCKAKFQTLLVEEDHSERHFHCILDCGSSVVYLVICSVYSNLSLCGFYTTCQTPVVRVGCSSISGNCLKIVENCLAIPKGIEPNIAYNCNDSCELSVASVGTM